MREERRSWGVLRAEVLQRHSWGSELCLPCFVQRCFPEEQVETFSILRWEMEPDVTPKAFELAHSKDTNS